MEKKLIKIIEGVLETDLSSYDYAEIKPEKLSDWDSFMHLTLILTLEDKFDIQFTAEEIVYMTNGYLSILSVLNSKEE